MNETNVTVVGRVVADPEHRETKAGLQFTTFRVASTIRRRSKEGVFVDAGTSFYNVAAYRSLGMNAHASIRKGDPVVVHGRQQVNTWQRQDGSWGSSVEIEALSVGHDLTFGTTSYSKAVRRTVDPLTGEILGDGPEAHDGGEPLDGPDEGGYAPVVEEPEVALSA